MFAISHRAWLLWVSWVWSVAPAGLLPADRPPPGPETPPAAVARAPGDLSVVDALIDRLTPEEKVGQLMIIGFPGKALGADVRDTLGALWVGGVTIFSRNVEDFAQVQRLLRDLRTQLQGQLPPFLALDQEGGTVIRVQDRVTVLPGNMALGATRSKSLAYLAGQATAIDLKRLGFNMNLAPVLDINSNPKNPVIGVRSYGESPQLVADLGTWFVRGQEELGIVTVAKHFPGHGDTRSDSHFYLPRVAHSLKRLQAIELYPFQQAIREGGLSAVMTAHIALPEIDDVSNLPATISARIISGLLRQDLQFDGLVITDGLEMKAIADKYGTARAAVRSILAGSDMVMVLWTKAQQLQVHQALLKAVQSGEIPAERLQGALRHILSAKLSHHLIPPATLAARGVIPYPDSGETRIPAGEFLAGGDSHWHTRIAQRIADESITLVKNRGQALPIPRVTGRTVVVVSPQPVFLREAARTWENVMVYRVPYQPRAARYGQDLQKLKAFARDAERVVIGAIGRRQVQLALDLKRLAPRVPVVLVSLGSPYYAAAAQSLDAFVCAYSYQESAIQAAVAVLAAQQTPRGRLPVSLSAEWPYSFGLTYADPPGRQKRIEIARKAGIVLGNGPEGFGPVAGGSL